MYRVISDGIAKPNSAAVPDSVTPDALDGAMQTCFLHCKKLVEEVPALIRESRRTFKRIHSRDLFVDLGDPTKSKVLIDTVSAGVCDLTPHPAEHAKNVRAVQDAVR